MADLGRTIGGIALMKVVVHGHPDMEKILDDAVELLKGLEPIAPTRKQGVAYCGACGVKLAGRHRYCWWCGRPVKAIE